MTKPTHEDVIRFVDELLEDWAIVEEQVANEFSNSVGQRESQADVVKRRARWTELRGSL